MGALGHPFVFSPANVDDNTLLNGSSVSSQPIIVTLSLLGTSSEMTYTRAPCRLKGNAKRKASSAGVCSVPGAAEGGCHQPSHLKLRPQHHTAGAAAGPQAQGVCIPPTGGRPSQGCLCYRCQKSRGAHILALPRRSGPSARRFLPPLPAHLTDLILSRSGR